jgi:predicted aldo/keto reductase-like oxidoreductase
MNYRINPKNHDQLSILGFGCMRFPTRHGTIDEPRTIAMMTSAVDQGINYFDTAYAYSMGKSEILLGKALAGGKRDRVKIATKIPPYLVRTLADVDKIFEKQLQRLQTGWIDYYLIHMLSDIGTWQRLINLGMDTWIKNKKENQQIRNIGFSFHGTKDQFIQLVDVYDWDFCQIQYNYLDINNQAGHSGLVYAASKGLPIIVMEPLRGGQIVNALPPQVNQIWDQAKPERSPAEWAFRWVWNHPEVTVALSGMSDERQLTENVQTASSAGANQLSSAELERFEKVRAIINENCRVGCTACGYCMPCPYGVDIPGCFAIYNEKYSLGKKQSWFQYLRDTGAMTAHPAYASLCTQCGQCERLCPQQIPIREKLTEVAHDLEGLFFRPVATLARKFMRSEAPKNKKEQVNNVPDSKKNN